MIITQSYDHTRSVNIKTTNENDVVPHRIRVTNGQFSAILRHKPLLSTLYYHSFYIIFTSPYDDVAPFFFQSTSIPGRGKKVSFSSQRNSTHRNNVTYQSKATRCTRTVHDLLATLPSIVHVGWKFGPLH